MAPLVFLKAYFKMLKETLENYYLMDTPAQIYICDESGMPLECKLSLQKGTKKLRQTMNGNKTQITVLQTIHQRSFNALKLSLKMDMTSSLMRNSQTICEHG